MLQKISKKTRKLSKLIHFLAALAAIFALSACKNTQLVGYTFKNEKLDQIKPGETTQSYIVNTLGTPSVVSTYGENTWYYIGAEYETLAFLAPKIKNQKIFAIVFDENNRVKSVKEYSEKDAKDIKIVSEITKTEGRDVGMLGELFGNVRRFNATPGKPRTP
jgi:outer membrane protein assembly factor BamE (lipoprotein component of BamABCDE complex)